MPAKPICFMVMPFGIKDVPAGTAQAPGRVDFDRLWQAAIRPALVALGYEPVRADQEVGALIIHEMLERLYFADLVLADMTIPNGNVYYEIGVRHAAKRDNCVLISADWSRPLFDTQQMRRLVYPLPQEKLSDDEAAAACAILQAGIPAMQAGESPMYQVLPGYPNPTADRALTMRHDLAKRTAFQERVRAIGNLGSRDDARTQAMALAAEYPAAQQVPTRPAEAIAITLMLRDQVGWADMLAYVQALPKSLREMPLMREQQALAQSKSGNHLDAIAALETLVNLNGDTSERRGLIGGRYKRLAKEAEAKGDRRAQAQMLERAIASYEAGMKLDLGNYYCASNLARLYRARADDGDEQRAQFTQQLTTVMAESAIANGRADEWARPTLLGAAFDAGDKAAAAKAVKDLQREGAAVWQLQTTLADLDASVAQMADPAQQQAFAALLQKLKDLL